MCDQTPFHTNGNELILQLFGLNITLDQWYFFKQKETRALHRQNMARHTHMHKRKTPNDKMETEQQNLFCFQLKVQARVTHTTREEQAHCVMYINVFLFFLNIINRIWEKCVFYFSNLSSVSWFIIICSQQAHSSFISFSNKFFCLWIFTFFNGNLFLAPKFLIEN